ncbi:hypothetical protein Fleli_0904 [Bernardetia litoralis DSM 6794]|uniref:Uncharacterized protein n=1 Tax=Bernardetia litoralis (strain ATCC 23117 / DSM 6794 / NBRC 15988 / NCIMB 1366 / Fx l1 / Sio-4) TaxID=880071 RepID=I4AHC4_BERLS|nr:hypothetical protein [Bernardetia litoralis]AFM03359.1 hypothetical protein Fleli_0904 [Bernardetia litoralis DSM 6794]
MKSLKEKFGKFSVSQKEAKNITGGLAPPTPAMGEYVGPRGPVRRCCSYQRFNGPIYQDCSPPRPDAIRCYHVNV